MKMKTNDACILLGRSDTASNRVRILHDDAVASAVEEHEPRNPQRAMGWLE